MIVFMAYIYFDDVGGFCPSGTKIRAAEFIQYLLPVGRGPSSNICPRCEPLLLSTTSTRLIPSLLSTIKRTASGLIGA